jgi:hypothetical protein
MVVLLALILAAPYAVAQPLSSEEAAVLGRQESGKPSDPPAEGAEASDGARPRGDVIVARNLAELPSVVEPGETVYVTDASGVRDKYKMQGVSPDASSLLLERNGAIRELQQDEVLNIAVKRGDRLWDGAVKGALIGASPMLITAIVCAAVDGCGAEALAVSLYTGLIGAGIGVGIDAAFKETHVVYSAVPPVSQPKIVVAPLITGQRRGALVQVNF